MTEQSASLSSVSLSQAARRKNAWLEAAFKRLFDVWVAALGLLFLGPVFAAIAVAIRRDSPGPVFYRGPRFGKDGRLFGILKFRTMREEPLSYQGPRLTAQDDPRITPLGRWLRDTKINELPQLWNVLAGEMSLVGPRPEDPELAKTWPAEVRTEVLSVRPGITSPASVLYRNEEALLKTRDLMGAYLGDILPSKLRLDQLYVRHHSLLLDLDILFWTFLVLLPKLGEFKPPEESLFWGPLSRLGRRYLSWFLVDTLITLGAVAISGFLWRLIGPLDIGWPRAIAAGVGFSLLFSLTGAAFRVQRTDWSHASALDALDLLPAAGLPVVVGIALDNLRLFGPLLPVRLLVVAAALAYTGYVVVRYRSRLLSGIASRWLHLRGGGVAASQERVLVIGGGKSGQFVAWMLQNGAGAGAFRVVGFIDDDLYKQGVRIQGVIVVGRRVDIPRLVARHDVGLIVFAIHNISALERRHLLEICTRTRVRVAIMPDFLGAMHRAIAAQDQPGLGEGQACQFCLARPSPVQSESWLAELAARARAGDLIAVQAQIQSAQHSYGND